MSVNIPSHPTPSSNKTENGEKKRQQNTQAPCSAHGNYFMAHMAHRALLTYNLLYQRENVGWWKIKLQELGWFIPLGVT